MQDDRWFILAHEDLRMAELALEESIYNQVCFHSQQYVEKILKGIIKNRGINPPHIHKLADLIQLSHLPLPEEIKQSILLLDRFYLPVRYPDALPGSLPEGLPGKEDAEEALETARYVSQYIKEL